MLLVNKKGTPVLKTLDGFTPVKHVIGNNIVRKLKEDKISIEELEKLGRVIRDDLDGRGVGGTPQGQKARGVYTHVCVSTRILNFLIYFIEIPITIYLLIGLRRTLDIPIDTLLGLDLYPTFLGGLKNFKKQHPIKTKILTKLTNVSATCLNNIEGFSEHAYNNQIGNPDTPDEVVLDAVANGLSFGWVPLLKIRENLKINIDDILGLSYSSVTEDNK